MLVALKDSLTQAQADARVKAIVLTGAAGKFSAGFDITHLAKQQAGGPVEDFGVDVNAFLIKLLEAGAKPTVAGARRRALRRAACACCAAALTGSCRARARASGGQRRAGRRLGGGHGLQRARGQQGRAAGPA